MKSTIPERLAVVETKVDELKIGHAAIMAKLDTMNVSLTRYRGAWGGIMLVFSALVAVASLLKGWWLKP